MCLTSKLHIIKISPESNIAVIWINIWDVQNDIKAKCLINRCFNISNYIATVKGTNMNTGVL